MAMQGTVIAATCLLLVANTIYGSPVGNCPSVDPLTHTDHLPDDKDCSLFYKCDHASPVLFNCPDGLHFNRLLEVCDWPANAGCSGNSGGDCPAVGECPQNEDENSVAKHLPHATNCNQFCKCEHGKPVTFDCPAGLHFNPVLEVCDKPEDAGCAGGSGASSAAPSSTAKPSTPAPSSAAPPHPNGECPAVGECPQHEDETSIAKHLPHATNCGQFCKCDHGKPVTFDCPAGLHFNPILEVCDWPQNAGCNGALAICDAVGSCPVYDQDSIVKHLPHRTDCGLYCRCNHGIPITEKCPDGLHFNAELEVCDYPSHAGCA